MTRKSFRTYVANILFSISQQVESWATILANHEEQPVIDDSEIYS